MKSFTKLAVLLLTLALLCTSVFAITAFAETAETATALLQADADGTTVGSISNNTQQGAGKNRFGEGTYRNLSMKTNGKLVEIVSRTLEEGETVTGSAQIQYTMNGTSGSALTSANYQYIVYDFEIGTYNEFFTSSAKGLYFTFGSNSGKTGRTLYLYQNTDGMVRLGTDVSKGSVAVLGTPGEDGLEARVTVVLEMAATVANSKMYVFANGAYSGYTTLGADISSYAVPAMRLWMEPDTSFTDYATKDMSVYLNYAKITSVNGSSATVAGDLAALCDMSELGVPVAIDQSHLFTLDETALVNDADTYAVKVAVDDIPEAYAVYSMSAIRDVFNLGTDVTLTLLEDLTITATQAYASSQAGAYYGFNAITEVGKNTFNLNGHTFSHLPLSYGPLYDESLGADAAENAALPGRGQTFQFGVADIQFVINGADAEGNNGKIVKVSSANDLFKQTANTVTYTNLVVNDVDFDITGSGIFGRRSGISTFDASFTDCTFAFTAGVGRFKYVDTDGDKVSDTLQDTGRTDYTNWDTADTTPSFSVSGLATKDEVFTLTDCTVSFSSSYGDVTVKGGSVLIGDCSDSTVAVTDARTRLNKDAKYSKSTVTVTGGSFYNTGTITLANTDLTLDGVTKSAYGSAAETDPAFFNDMKVTGGSITVKDSYVSHASYIECLADVTVKFENTDIVLTTTFVHARKNLNDDGTAAETSDGGTKSSSTVDFVNCRFSQDVETSARFPVGSYYSTTTMTGCKASHEHILKGQTYNIAEGCYVTDNTDEDAGAYPYVVKAFNFAALAPVANLTLYSDIRFNLLLPYATTANYITGVNGTALANLETVTDSEGNIIYYCVPYTVAAHAANEVITVSFNPVNKGSAVYNLTKTISIPEYIGLVYADASNSDSWALMSDLVDYVVATMNYFAEKEGTTADVSAFTALQGNANYVDNGNTEIVGSEVGYSAVTGYIKGAYLNVEESNTKFVFVAGTADKVTLSYTSLTEGKVTKTFENCTENQALVLEMRAYDLNAVINISVNDGEATGTYDLAAYANSEEAADADDVLLEMYNYAVSAKTYKETLLAAAENN